MSKKIPAQRISKSTTASSIAVLEPATCNLLDVMPVSKVDSVLPDVAKFCHFGKHFKIFANFWSVFFTFCKILSLLWPFCYGNPQIFIVINGQILKK